MVRQLPGPVTSPSRAPRGGDPIVKASECGPILRALVAFGPAARPYVIARASDADPKVRAWAVRLLGELTGRPSAEAVAQRVVLDRDAEVRRAAHLACQLLYRDADSALALRDALLRTAFSQQTVITQRLAAIDALSDLRDAKAIPKLIELLLDPNPGTAAGAKLALVVLARQDFGYDTKSWESWWTRNCDRERIEWVIDSLEHRQPAIRQAAAEELRAMSRIYVGDFDDDSPEARARVQKKYRDWWATGGRAMSFAPKS
ncbi:MAG: HEAT repeat domain-containing protein [Polyangiaceae bacterium]